MLKIRQPKERVTVVYPWMTSICKNNPCASAILALSTFRHNEYGWKEHYLTRDDLKEALFNQFTIYQIGKALKQLFADKIFTQIKRKCYDRTTVFSLNEVLINKFLSNYKTNFPITQKQKPEQPENAASVEKPQVADSQNGNCEINESIKEALEDKEDINNPVDNFSQCVEEGSIVIELESILSQLLEEKARHNEKLTTGYDMETWAKEGDELRTALLETQQALDEARAMQNIGEQPLQELLDVENVKPNLVEMKTIEDVPVDMATPHGPVTNQLSQNFYNQQKTSSERTITNKHMKRLKHFSKRFGNSVDEMIWFLKNAYTERGYTTDKVMGILSAIAPTFTRPNGMSA
ncbi:hypothetical protein [Piscirickettsia litoralis]|uniref:Uncharacterized protein n=1 Tax=Piscirickettsia litoralis TaxID=1891921 RepID=A0ABX2ZWG1_9GAMM|nr:hypothetical protein [Piscirickettsia litoralis]ODN40954.1 hypothetical protein BGC07_19010 [Piscirickettsia litoralis]